MRLFKDKEGGILGACKAFSSKMCREMNNQITALFSLNIASLTIY